MRLEVRNLQSQETYSIGPEGMIFGREGGPADIKVADQSVSKRHAKIYSRDGGWWLEDLKSVNGTVVNNRRITDPVPLTPGFTFALSKHRFEVVRIEGEEVLGTASSLPQPRSAESEREASASKRSRGGASMAGETAPPSSAATGGPAGAPEPKGVGYFFVAVPKAVAYFLAAIPLMALNPLGTIKKSVHEPRFAPMGGMEIAAYAIPAVAFSALMGTFGAVFAALITGGFAALGGAIGAAIGGIITAAISAAITAVVVALFGHKILAWLVRILGGTSDDRSRTNYFITLYTAQALVAIPNALSAIFGAVVARLAASFGFIYILNALPAVVQTVAGMVLFYASYAWFKHFGVARWVQIVLLVLVGLSGLGGAARVVGSVITAVSSIGSGPAPTVLTPEEAVEAAKRAEEEAKKAVEAASGDADKDDDDGEDKKAEAAPDGDKKAEAEPSNGGKAEPKKTDDPPPAASAERNEPKSDGKKGGGTMQYAEYVAKLAAVEKTIESDPTWVIRDEGVARTYEGLLRCMKDAEERGKPSRSRDYDPVLAPLYKRKAEAFQFSKCRDDVEKLHRQLGL